MPLLPAQLERHASSSSRYARNAERGAMLGLLEGNRDPVVKLRKRSIYRCVERPAASSSVPRSLPLALVGDRNLECSGRCLRAAKRSPSWRQPSLTRQRRQRWLRVDCTQWSTAASRKLDFTGYVFETSSRNPLQVASCSNILKNQQFSTYAARAISCRLPPVSMINRP